MTDIRFARDAMAACKGCERAFLVGPAAALKRQAVVDRLPETLREAARALAGSTSPGLHGAVAESWIGDKAPKLVVGVLPDAVSRHNSPSRASAVFHVLTKGGRSGAGRVAVVLVVEDEDHTLAVVNAVARAFPGYDRKKDGKPMRVDVAVVLADGSSVSVDRAARATVEGSQLAAQLVDTPPTELDPSHFAAEAKASLRGIPGVRVREIKGDALLKAGLGGIHGVGRTAVSEPRLLIAEYVPGGTPGSKKAAASSRRRTSGPHVALVGKGITYDTGGLHLKPRGGMEGMKCDMGGAAATLGAFLVAAKLGVKRRVSLLLCLAENAIGPLSVKPDDILDMHSGLTVEINNTDAEGRLLLADGASYAARKLGADVILDAATLTGAQMIATGEMHAAVVSNDDGVEAALVEAGRESGDLCHPLPFAPEFYRKEFESPVADMRNSVKNRMNAQSSCAAEFIHWHIADTDVRWGHVDLAGPAFVRDRGTGFGVALLARAVERV